MGHLLQDRFEAESSAGFDEAATLGLTPWAVTHLRGRFWTGHGLASAMASLAPLKTPKNAFLPVCRADLEARGWDQVDIVIVTGDAYVDHPVPAARLQVRPADGQE